MWWVDEDSTLEPVRDKHDSMVDLQENLPEVKRVLGRIPEEFSVAILHWLQHPHLTQHEAARMLGWSQTKVCQRRQRAIKAIAWAQANQPHLDPLEVYDMLEGKMPEEQRWTLAWSWREWRQSRNPLGYYQSRVRSWWVQASKDTSLPYEIQSFFALMVENHPHKPYQLESLPDRLPGWLPTPLTRK